MLREFVTLLNVLVAPFGRSCPPNRTTARALSSARKRMCLVFIAGPGAITLTQASIRHSSF
jgi:hypothetical protein